MKFKEFLRRTIGGRLRGDRLHIFRKYWCAMLGIYADLGSEAALGDDNKTDEGRQKMTDKIIEKFSREGIDEIFFKSHQRSIAAWRSENRIQQRRNAAKKRWEKQKPS
jgi:hypothetical protein